MTVIFFLLLPLAITFYRKIWLEGQNYLSSMAAAANYAWVRKLTASTRSYM